ncbi:hypothetical protein M4951_02475 [Blastopirellula sp. J2-11]|uniref:BatD family protein n=1 Tax=Blastopirellula sp. J2-11 TaxID=2943192 RepID=UPI0021C6BE43|nr:hypothetical protein [Blastopirellula sp. J2-11]UUO07186.1 hypothetical protein M4951_02475 [Blastopirellula sp. J2-11]
MILLRPAIFVLLLGVVSAVHGADVELVKIQAPAEGKTYWVGQRIPLFIELRAPGSFDGASSFSLPQIPQTVLVKIGNPVVSSEDHDGDSWFVQTHEFALFTQKSGTLEIPEFPVRFSNHDGFTGPVTNHDEKVPSVRIEVKSPPDRESHGFLVTTEIVDISESWNPPPGDVKQGDIAVQTITQTAKQMTGMALQPPTEQPLDGVHAYPAQPEVSVKTDRGEFTGTRIDKITYRFESAGTVTIPAATYSWWNPVKQEYGTKTLPAATFHVTAVPQPLVAESPPASLRRWIVGLAIVVALILLGAWRYRPIQNWLTCRWQKLNPPDRVAARRLLHACRTNNAQQAEIAWASWQATRLQSISLSDELLSAVQGLHQSNYGAVPLEAWNGAALAHAFQRELRQTSTRPTNEFAMLPKLNPENVIA